MNRLAQRELPKSQTPSYCKFMPDARRKNNPNTRSCLLLMSFASDGQFVFTENGCFHPLMWALFDDANRCRERGSDACCRESDYTELLYQLTTTTLLPPKGAIVQVGSKFDVRPSSVRVRWWKSPLFGSVKSVHYSVKVRWFWLVFGSS